MIVVDDGGRELGSPAFFVARLVALDPSGSRVVEFLSRTSLYFSRWSDANQVEHRCENQCVYNMHPGSWRLINDSLTRERHKFSQDQEVTGRRWARAPCSSNTGNGIQRGRLGDPVTAHEAKVLRSSCRSAYSHFV